MTDKKMYFIPFHDEPAAPVDLDRCKQALEEQIDGNSTAKEMVQLIASSDAPLMVKLDAVLGYVTTEETALSLWVSDWIRYRLGDTGGMSDPETNGKLWCKQAQVLLDHFWPWLKRYQIRNLYNRSSLLRALCEHGEWFDSEQYSFGTDSLPFDCGEEQSFTEVLQMLYATDWHRDYPELWVGGINL